MAALKEPVLGLIDQLMVGEPDTLERVAVKLWAAPPAVKVAVFGLTVSLEDVVLHHRPPTAG